MSDLLARLATAVERGNQSVRSPHPPDLAGEDGAREICALAIEEGIPPHAILRDGLTAGMNAVGDRFAKGLAFIPELLMSARAMKAAMELLAPSFADGSIRHRGTVVIGTVAGDLHDIGKNVVRMVLEGDGWRVVDLGVDVMTGAFLDALAEHPDAHVAMSALLTTTMPHMTNGIATIRERRPETRIFVGGAPVTAEFAEKVGADGYFPEPLSFARHLAGLA